MRYLFMFVMLFVLPAALFHNANADCDTVQIILEPEGAEANGRFGEKIAASGLFLAVMTERASNDAFLQVGAIDFYEKSSYTSQDYTHTTRIWPLEEYQSAYYRFGNIGYTTKIMMSALNNVLVVGVPSADKTFFYDIRDLASTPLGVESSYAAVGNSGFGSYVEACDHLVLVSEHKRDEFGIDEGGIEVFAETSHGEFDWHFVGLIEPMDLADSQFGIFQFHDPVGMRQVIMVDNTDDMRFYLHKLNPDGETFSPNVIDLSAETFTELGPDVMVYGQMMLVTKSYPEDAVNVYYETSLLSYNFQLRATLTSPLDGTINFGVKKMIVDRTFVISGSGADQYEYTGEYNSPVSAYTYDDNGSPIFIKNVWDERVYDSEHFAHGYGDPGEQTLALIEGSTLLVASPERDSTASKAGAIFIFGDICGLPSLDCYDEPCLNNGTCSPSVFHESDSSFLCDCYDTGYEGDICEIEFDECVSSPCENNGTCSDLFKGYSCNCSNTGYEGDHCQMDIDDCASSPCEHNGTCTDNGAMLFHCSCNNTGYTGDMCETDIDDCASSPCERDAPCTDLILGFDCDCTGTGAEGDSCEIEIDDCLSMPCGAGVCKDKVSEYKCTCDDTGFEGPTCMQDVNDCASSPCQNSGNCTDIGTNMYQCDCSQTGFKGEYCDIAVDECKSSPCQNNGLCFSTGDRTYECECGGTGFTGDYCEINVDDCLSMPCMNSGKCVDAGVHAFQCMCPFTHTGSLCMTAVGSGDVVINDDTVEITISVDVEEMNTTVCEYIEEFPALFILAMQGNTSSNGTVMVTSVAVPGDFDFSSCVPVVADVKELISANVSSSSSDEIWVPLIAYVLQAADDDTDYYVLPGQDALIPVQYGEPMSETTVVTVVYDNPRDLTEKEIVENVSDPGNSLVPQTESGEPKIAVRSAIPPEETPSKSDDDSGVILPAIVVSLVGVLVACMLFFWYDRKEKKKKNILSMPA